MIDLLAQEFTAHYQLRRSKVEISNKTTCEEHFDLDDGDENMIVPYAKGNVSFEHAEQTEVEVINYEKFINSLQGTSFEKGRKRCDFILYEKGGTGDGFFILNEQTSTNKSTETLSKPIFDKKTKEVLFPGGKYEKVEVQLYQTLTTLKDVPGVSLFIKKYKRKICLMSYIIREIQSDDTPSVARKAFTVRYKKIEAQETAEKGALLVHPTINSQGFEYRRIDHKYSFKLS